MRPSYLPRQIFLFEDEFERFEGLTMEYFPKSAIVVEPAVFTIHVTVLAPEGAIPIHQPPVQNGTRDVPE